MYSSCVCMYIHGSMEGRLSGWCSPAVVVVVVVFIIVCMLCGAGA